MGGLRGRGLSVVWHHGGLEYRHTRSWGLANHIMQRGLLVYGHVGEGGGKGVQNRQKKIETVEAYNIEVASGCGRTMLETFRNHVDRADPRTPEAASRLRR